jgi:hypothetical protein
MRFGIFVERGPKKTQAEAFSEASEEGDEVLLEELRRRYDLQQAEIETVNNKAGIVLAYLGAVFIVFLNLAPDVATQIAKYNLSVIILTMITFLLFLLAAISCLIAMRSRIFLSPIGIEKEEVEAYLVKDREDLVLQLLSQYSRYTQENIPIVTSKNKWLVAALWFSLAFTAMLATTVVGTNLL